MAEAASGSSAARPAGDWMRASIQSIEALSARISKVVLLPQSYHPALAGQHLDVRLTADDGYQAQRSYSLLSPPEATSVYALAIERLDDGEVSSWFHDMAQVGDELEILGPVGGHFVWQAQQVKPALLIGGGSGMVPLLSMAAHHAAQSSTTPMTLVAAARTLADVILQAQLQSWEQANPAFHYFMALSRETKIARPQDHAGRVNADLLRQALVSLQVPITEVICYICGSNRFVETVIPLLRELGFSDSAVKTERFGDAVA